MLRVSRVMGCACAPSPGSRSACVDRTVPRKSNAESSFSRRTQGVEVMAHVTLTTRPPLPPFTRESAIHKVRLAEDGWNTRDPEKVALAYVIDSRWRNRSEFVNGREDILAFLRRKWTKELD